MNPNQPVGNQPPVEFTQKALDTKFSYSFTRKQCIILVNALRPIELPIADLRSKVLREILEEIELTAIQSITPDDYEKPTTKPTEEGIVTN